MERGMNRDFVEMLCALNETGADFLIVGAYPNQTRCFRSESHRFELTF
jgi:hypothetical protein